jgi:hypothetical protein
MNFVRTLSRRMANNSKISLGTHSYNFMLSQNSKDVITFLDGKYKIADKVGEYYKNIKKYEMHESLNLKPFIKIKEEK